MHHWLCGLVLGSASAVAWAAPAVAGHSGLPVDLEIPQPPSAVAAVGKQHLYYELHISNFSSTPFELSQLSVLDEHSTDPLLTLHGSDLSERTERIGVKDAPAAAVTLGAGARLVVFLDVPLAAEAPAPHALHHRLRFSLKLPDGSTRDKEFDGATVAVRPTAAKVLQPPLSGGSWIAADLMDNRPDSHWRSLMAVDGKERIAQRFATDWVKLGSDGRLFHGDVADNHSWYAYGSPVLAVADAVVSDLHDGQLENVPTHDRAVPVTLDTIAGNYLILDLGDGRYAMYAHLQPGSLRVKLGDHVRAGQTLALLGNSGNSDAPHLHFQVTDGNAPLAAEGLPFEYDHFKVQGKVAQSHLDDDVIFKGDVVSSPGSAPTVDHGNELPGNNDLVTFP
jgi:murein DD-endopeptidase MepM/ murein hydrolase activator NlpD